MDLLGLYESDASDCENQKEEVHRPASAPPPPPLDPGTCAKRRKKVDYFKLPVARPFVVDAINANAEDEEEPPLRKAAELENSRSAAGRSLLELLPAPRVTLGADTLHGGGGSRIDLSGLEQKPVSRLPDVKRPAALLPNGHLPQVFETGDVPEDVLNHPMFSEPPPAQGGADGPSEEDLHLMRKTQSFTQIQAEEMKDPDWYMHNQVSGGPGLHKGKKVSPEVSMYDASSWQHTTHANPSRIQKRKHQINWLAQEAMDKEAEMLDRNATSRLTKAQTQMKYGW